MAKETIKRIVTVVALGLLVGLHAIDWMGANARAQRGRRDNSNFAPDTFDSVPHPSKILVAASGTHNIASTPAETLDGPILPDLNSQNIAEDKPVEQVRKNIRVLKGLPDSRLLTAMHLIRASLGVRCDFCHVAENDKYWMDDKPAKRIARQHIQMTFDINKANFGGRTVVTCNTCHQGQTKPSPIPRIGQGVFTDTTREEDGARPPALLPTVDQVLDKYVQALGGRGAIDRVKTRVTKMSLLRPKLVNSGTPKAAMINRGETWSVETFQKAPDKYLAVITSPGGVIYQGLNGSIGWVRTSSGQREMSSAERSRIKRQADLYQNLKLKEQYSGMMVSGIERVNDRDAYVVAATTAEGKVEKLFFDVQIGLLLRKILLTETMLGMDPEQTDFEDYREVDEVRLPFTVRVSYLDDNHLGTTRKLTEVKHNAPIDDAKFDGRGY